METKNYAEMLKNCKVSERTASLIACKMSLGDLYDQIYDALSNAFGETGAECVIGRKYSEKSAELDSIINEFIMDSIYDNTCDKNLSKI